MKAYHFYINLFILIVGIKSFAQNNPYSSENTLRPGTNITSTNTRSDLEVQQNFNTRPVVNIGYEMNKSAMGGQPNLSRNSFNNLNNNITTGDVNPTLVLLNFDASIQNDQTLLRWNISHAAPDNNFDIERKDANGTWQKIGNVESYTTRSSGLQYEFTDATPLNGINMYRLKQNNNGIVSYSAAIHAELNGGNQGLLFQNYPNPFIETTTIQYQMRNSGPVKIVIYDLDGRQIAIPVNQNQAQGSYQVEWNGRDFPAGTYIYKIVTNEDNITQTMIKSR